MECIEESGSAEKSPTKDENVENSAASPASQHQQSPAQSPSDARGPEEKAKRTKHTRVHKREKELYGLVTPVFLPLLDARDTSPTKRKEKKQPKPDDAQQTATRTPSPNFSRDAEKSKEARKSRKETKDMDVAASGKESHDVVKKLKRSIIKKSSLRHKDTPRARRKRVSLVIDGQTVLPADTVIEPPLMSPSSEATSASNSTTSFDDMIDPRLTGPAPSVHVQQDAVRHSLPRPMSRNVYSPAKSLADLSAPAIHRAEPSPPLAEPRSPSIPVGSQQSIPRTFLDPSPNHPASIPEIADPDPASSLLDTDDLADEHHWDTYVGGLHGSGVDDVDQAGSYGYPSSLGASYLESYMQNRPLSVRMQAADKAGLTEREKREMLAQKREEEEEEEFGMDIGGGGGKGRDLDVDDEMDIVGSMEGF